MCGACVGARSVGGVLSRVVSFALRGIDSLRITVEVDVHTGLPSFSIVGLGDRAVREARERVRAALQNSGFAFPQRRVTVNLAPAYVRKVGAGFDLAIACGILVACDEIPAAALDGMAVFGELSLGGELRRGRGTLAIAEGAARAGVRGLIVPASDARRGCAGARPRGLRGRLRPRRRRDPAGRAGASGDTGHRTRSLGRRAQRRPGSRRRSRSARVRCEP